ncbi:ammonium transporter [Croceibacter atlanticus]|jgi:Amt family ammonium transporter|uniref:Ammonium transporter n=1 Tax=Croceibacter atlanticus (strain ATCC BAA-628 / JCM 21780 / CIP 108009 / IAM 15332 / KCTC 12090 / HTCC2559) TaxID=216432 RepID=A3U857_CROAH|nr:ammonium transporter [Croceibacter atlanticus]EAP88424.1 ammonium transporter [Croceibacter atlanticus HTCC2559]MBW4969442.1 ammonium transporter [Croceibacter atlanticus]
MSKKLNFIILTVIVIISLICSAEYTFIESTNYSIDTGDTAWMIVASAFVLLMTPGLAFFYGGLVNRKNVISTMLQSFVALGVMSVLWVFIGFSLAFGESYHGIIGNPFTYFNFNNVTLSPNPDFSSTIPFLLFALFQLKFAIIAPALITGSFAERIRFRSYILIMILFSLFIYCPLAHMTWHPEGLLRNWGVLDFAGGTVVHLSAGLAALAGAIYLGKRKKMIEEPANIPFVILGTGLLWFGWFGFNAGSALGANIDAVIAFANTNLASATSMITWIFLDRMLNKKMSAIGACIGAIVGLVAITPAAGFVNLGQSIFIGFFAAVISNIAIQVQKQCNIDDTLDVFPSHGVGGIVGMILTGVLAKDVGLIYGETETFMFHLIALILVSIGVFGGSLLIYKIVDLVLPVRVREDQEERGLDNSQHGERI